jgi:branched-chain amino acid transport system permease protein
LAEAVTRASRAEHPWVAGILRTAEWRDPWILILILAAVPAVADPYRLTSLGSFLPYAMAAVALSLVWGYCGVLSVGQAVFFGLGAYAVAKALSGRGIALGLVLGVIAAVALAIVAGWILSRMSFGRRADSFLVAVITFCAAGILGQFAIKLTGLTGGYNGLTVAQQVMPIDPTQAYYVVLVVFAACLLFLVMLSRSDGGRTVVAVRDNPNRLRYLGVDVDAVRRRVFIIGAVVTAFAGVMDALYNGVVSPDKIGFQFSTQILLWCAIGGRTSLTGAAIGALLVNVGQNELSGTLVNYWQMALGVAFVLVVLFVPDGLYWPLRRLGARFEARSAPAVSTVATRSGNQMTGEPVLKGLALKQRFGAFRALDVDHVDLYAAQVTALIGPNGAGKSTLIGVLSGGLPDASGTALIMGEEVVGSEVHAVARLGLRRKFQAPNVFESLTLGENLRLGRGVSTSRLRTVTRRSRSLELTGDVWRLLSDSGLEPKLGMTAGSLSHGQKQFLEVCVVLNSAPAIVLLDEPTAGLSSHDRAAIGQLLRALAAKGVAVLIIEHDFDFIREVSDRILVMHQGALIADGTVAEVSADEYVHELYVGGVSG